MALHQLLCGVTALILLSTRGNCQTHSPSAHSPPTHSPPAHSPSAHSPPTHSPSAHSPPAHSPSAHSPPTHSPSAHSPPTHSPPAHSPSAHSPPAHSPSAHSPSAHSPPAHSPSAHSPPAHSPSAHSPPAHSPSAHSPSAHSPSAHSPPTHSPPTHSPPPLPKCGMWRYEFGGVRSDNPFMVRLHNDQGHLCAGSLINEEWLLTAAHCVLQHQAENITVVLGRHRRSGPNQTETHREVDRVECHPHYNPYTYDNDICLLKLSHPVEFNDYIQPVCLASAESTFHTGTKGLVTGWRKTDNVGPYSYYLQESIVGNNECRCTYPNLTENMMCAGAKDKDACEGGGLLMTKAFGQWIGTGIWSFGKESCKGPRAYTRLSQYEDFIRMVTTKHTNYTTSSYGNDSLPGFITHRSMGNDSDSHFTCPTAPPHTTEYPPHTEFPPHTTEGGKGGGSIFDSGENLIRSSHFTHFFSLGGILVLSFYALV